MPFKAAILIVSGSIEDCACPRSTFESAGFSVSLAVGAAAALEALSRERHEAVIVDMDAAGIEGHDTCRAIFGLGANAPKIIAVSSDSSLSAKLGCFMAGANSFLSKPVQTIELLDKIRYIESYNARSGDADPVPG
ncbi:MAG: Response regulator MprA [bacterium ADurb.Bin236]|nr:MAG: Response regulator MprA [bacterium ADurb.Bin236]HOY61747.1 response regulator [bacterium]HPN93413.1 response regulator [bacterium]